MTVVLEEAAFVSQEQAAKAEDAQKKPKGRPFGLPDKTAKSVPTASQDRVFTGGIDLRGASPQYMDAILTRELGGKLQIERVSAKKPEPI